MNKVKEYVEGLKVQLEFCNLANLEGAEEEGLTYQEIVDELDEQGIKNKVAFDLYVDEYGNFKEVPSDCIYCDEFYIDQPEDKYE